VLFWAVVTLLFIRQPSDLEASASGSLLLPLMAARLQSEMILAVKTLPRLRQPLTCAAGRKAGNRQVSQVMIIRQQVVLSPGYNLKGVKVQ
jgi:hypothetical protein